MARHAFAQITAAIKEAATQAAGNSILRVELTGQTPLAWRVRRDMDLLSEQIREAAEAIGTAWIEKVECHLRQPEVSEAREDPRFELQALMQTLMQDEAVKARAVEMSEWLVGELPAEIRSEFGADQQALAVRVATILVEGCEDVVAMMMGEDAEGDR